MNLDNILKKIQQRRNETDKTIISAKELKNIQDINNYSVEGDNPNELQIRQGVATQREAISMTDKFNEPDASIIDRVFGELEEFEGEEGDNLRTDIPTGRMGMTDATRKMIDPDGNKEDLQVIRKHLKSEYDVLNKFQGFKEAPDEFKVAMLDLSYNVGSSNMKRYTKMKKAIKEQDYLEAMKQTLDTANTAGKSVKGIAVRRAINYNKVANSIGKDGIYSVELKNDSGIVYKDKNGETIFEYMPKTKQIAQGSIPGIVKIG